MFPTQNHSEGLGNLVALPLQGQALRQGNSAFVDENWNPYYDQWKLLTTVHQLSKNEIEEHIYKWKEELSIPQTLLTMDLGKRIKPWKKDENFHSEDVIERLSIVLADGIYVIHLIFSHESKTRSDAYLHLIILYSIRIIT